MTGAGGAWGADRPLPEPFEAEGRDLLIDGVSARELAERYGTPLYVSSEERIRANVRRLRGAFEERWSSFRLLYALKANSNPAIVRVLVEEGCGADCSSPAELLLARELGVPRDRMLYTSVFPTDDDLAAALAEEVAINLDDPALLPRLLARGRPPRLSFRLNPGPAACGPEGLRFSGNSKFGTSLAQALAAYRAAHRAGVESFGAHTMPGSNVLDPSHFTFVGRFLARAAISVARAVGAPPSFLDMGGGFGVPYRPREVPLDVDAVAENVARELRHVSPSSTELWAEPGRYLVCDSTVLLTRVVDRKERRVPFVGTDAGMNTLLRPALYGAYHPVYAATHLGERPERPVHLVGPVCENTDVLARSRRLPRLAPGDILAVGNAGAYGFSMASQYNSRPRPAEVMVREGRVRVIRQREDPRAIWAGTGLWEAPRPVVQRALAAGP